MREHYGMNFQEAMQALLDHSALQLTHEAAPVMAKEKKEFKLPEANDNMHRVYAYLIKQSLRSPAARSCLCFLYQNLIRSRQRKTLFEPETIRKR